MRDQQWIKTLDDGRMVKFTYQGLAGGGAFITAQIAGNEVVYSIMLRIPHIRGGGYGPNSEADLPVSCSQ
jgi:hypothetical protein